MGVKVEVEDDEKSGYDPDLDVVVEEDRLDEKHVVRVVCYDGGEKKVVIVKTKKNGKPFSLKRIPLPLVIALGKVITKWVKAGVLA